MASDWRLARKNLEKSVRLQAKYYNKKHRDVQFREGDLVLLSTRNLRLKGIPTKLQKRFVGPFRILDTVGQQAYRLALPNDWKIHPVFHVSLLRDWKSADVQEDVAVSQEDTPEVEEPFGKLRKLSGGVRSNEKIK